LLAAKLGDQITPEQQTEIDTAVQQVAAMG
jgi:hypothetical protein